jgi:hypothetical protein
MQQQMLEQIVNAQIETLPNYQYNIRNWGVILGKVFHP